MLDYGFSLEHVLAHINLEGPAGRLEARLDSNNAGRAVLLCHPHPLYGGSMDDLVLDAIAEAHQSAGYDVLRFNFRGVGHSEGSHDNGRGEVDDILAAADWLENAGYDRIILGGYSFGAIMAMAATARRDFDGAVLVAPPVSMAADIRVPSLPLCVITGDEDQIVDAAEVETLFSPGRVHVIHHADHFFHGFHHQIRTIVTAFLRDVT